MTVIEQLKEFFAMENSFPRVKWLRDDKMQVYVRRGMHIVGGKASVCFDIANVEVYKQKQGTWTAFLWQAHEMNPWDCTFVECVLNPILASWLLKNGFSYSNEVKESFVLFKKGSLSCGK